VANCFPVVLIVSCQNKNDFFPECFVDIKVYASNQTVTD